MFLNRFSYQTSLVKLWVKMLVMALRSQVVQKAWVSSRTKAFYRFVTCLKDKSGYFSQEFWPLQTARTMLLQILNQAVLSSKNEGSCRSSQRNLELTLGQPTSVCISLLLIEDQEVYSPFDIQSERQFPKERGQKQQKSYKSKNIYVQVAPPASHTVHSWFPPLYSLLSPLFDCKILSIVTELPLISLASCIKTKANGHRKLKKKEKIITWSMKLGGVVLQRGEDLTVTKRTN